MSNVTYEVEAGTASETSTGVDRGIDVDFTATLTGVEITVPANADEDDCLAAAAAQYIAEHPEMAGYDLSPRWTDEDDRETVTLTVNIELDGEVTLLPNEDGSPGYSSWGMVDHWLDGRTVAILRKLSSADHTDVCTAIIEATAPVARAFAG